MEKVQKRFWFFAFWLMLFASAVSASMSISQPDLIYNRGDDFEITITLNSPEDVSNFVVATLVCSGDKLDIYRAPIKVAGGEEKEVIISMPLDSFIAGNINGKCFVETKFGKESITSRGFEITGNIDVTSSLSHTSVNPGDEIAVSGDAVKKNGELFNGFVEVKVDSLDILETEDVIDGSFGVSLVIPENAPAENYEIKVGVYDSDDEGDVVNEGSDENVFRVNQIIKEVGVAVDSQSVKPENSLSYRVVVYDQSGQYIDSEASVVVYNPLGGEFNRFVVQTTGSQEYPIESNFEPGKWEISVKVDGIEAKKEFLVEEYKKLKYSLEGQILTIYNMGNVPYTGPVEIRIDDVTDVRNVENLGVGESKLYRLLAPDGKYEIGVNDGSESKNLGSASLTGRTVSIKDIGGSLMKNIIWLVIIVVLLALSVLVVYFYRKKNQMHGFLKRKSEGKYNSFNAMPNKIKPSDENVIDKGEKQISTIVSLNIRNLEELKLRGKDSIQAIDSALWKAKESGAKIYSDGEFRVLVLAPILVKGADSALKGLVVAEDLSRLLREHNKRTEKEIKFGIGVNSGNLIVESSGGKFRFISLDNIISSTKRISQHAIGEVFVSDKLRRAMAGKIKGEKIGDYWRLDKVLDRSIHGEYLSGFREREKSSKKTQDN